MPKTFTPEQKAKRNAYARERMRLLKEANPEKYRALLDQSNRSNKPRAEWSPEKIALYNANRIAKRNALKAADPEAFRQWESEKNKLARVRRIARDGIEAERARATKGWTQHKYGLTPQQIQDMIETSGRRCKCCKRHHDELRPGRWKGRRLFVDHCHKTGKVRGILCFTCNAMMGFVKDDPVVFDVAAAYLRSHA